MHVSVNYSPVRDAAGEVIEISQTARDITERIQAQQAVQVAERRRNEFLTMLGHELRNPLGTIRTSVELLKRGEARPASDGDVDAVEVLDRQVDYLADLVDDLSDAARMNTGEFDLRLDRLDLSAVVTECVEDYGGIADRAGVELEAQVPGEPVSFTGDRTRLVQVLGNLMRNACTHTPEGGRVEVLLERDDDAAVVSVRDEGVGLEEEDLEKVFDLFHRGSTSSSGSPEDGGLGLGLPVARRIVELHGGTLQATSEGSGQGSTFSFRLPLSRDSGREAGPTESELPADVAGEAPDRRILIVEDNEDAGRLLARLLRAMGHHVSLAGDGETGLEAARDRSPDLVLCDIDLPGEMDGYDLATALRREPATEGIRLVALTGFGNDVDRERARDAGFDEHLTKPVRAEALERVLSAD